MCTIETTKDILLITTSILSVGVSLYGVKIWRKQLKETVEFELARRILKSTYGLRNAIKYFRNSFMITKPYIQKERENLSQEEKRYLECKSAWWERADIMDNALQIYLVNKLEAEVLWGQESCDLLNKLPPICHDLAIKLNFYLGDLDPENRSEERSEESKKFILECKYDLMADPSGNDTLTIKLNSVVEEIERYLKQYLPQKKQSRIKDLFLFFVRLKNKFKRPLPPPPPQQS